ncbi:MAG: cystathionine gamma-synthase family protein [Gammaproteobacteria bacterium]|nr:cystathionine gamma-synthase family protein [Gammaproteobacteria bacterium]MYH85519.1 cystathionine gamma-synthase family protein [Gammaproteobacteria bacterium]MYK05410.1 cystathionine gamma-synthase family protein [Gammaproteobacteria bacterium]
MPSKGFTTRNLHSDREDHPEHGVLHKPVHPSVAYGYADARELAEVFQGKRKGYAYGRQANPTVTALQKRISDMEDGIGSIAFSTGMAAIAALTLTLLKAGDHMISSAFLFGNTNSFFRTLERLGIEVDFVDATSAAAVEEKVRGNTRLVFVETIANPVTQVADLEGIGELCRRHGLLYVVDNTMTSPHLYLPKTAGAGLVVNSLTKCIGGHGNALGGAVTDTGSFDWSDYPNILDIYRKGDAGEWGLLQIRKKGLRDMGASLAPEAAHTLATGSESLPLRMDQSCANAMALARLCADHPAVTRVYYPGLPEHPQHERARKLFRAFGALFSIDLKAGSDCFDFLNSLEIVISSSNLGDTRSLGIPVAHTIYYEMGPERRKSMGVGDSMLRFSIGIEDQGDLIADFSQALEKL